MRDLVQEGTEAAAPAAAQAPPAVVAKDLSLVFQTADTPVTALADVNLTIARGEFVSFIGPSGCGKTTLMRVIADLERPTAGTMRVNGVSAEEARLARAYGYVFQAAALYPWRNVLKNVMLPLEITGVPAAARRERALMQLALVGLEGFERKYPWQLSGGMQQRVSIARALALEPALLLMDEPFGALDALTRAKLQDELLEIVARTQSTVVMVTHDVDEAVLLSDKIVMMTNGPAATIGEVLHVDLPRPRSRVELAEDARYVNYRKAVIDFLYTRQGHVEKAA